MMVLHYNKQTNVKLQDFYEVAVCRVVVGKYMIKIYVRYIPVFFINLSLCQK